MHMIKICSVKVQDTAPELVKEIIQIKQQAWDYSDAQQIQWMQDNLRDDDMHMLLFDDDALCAYLNLVRVRLAVDGVCSDAIGIGNVCVAKDKRSMNYGRLLMQAVNTMLKKSNQIGILLCRDRLVGFYENSGWTKVCDGVQKNIAGSDFTHHVFLYNAANMPKKEIKTDINF